MEKKYLLIIVVLHCIIIKANAQPPNWQWAKSAGANFADFGTDIVVDSSGNSYVTGSFSGNGNNITFGSITLTCNGVNDVFVVKYDASGNVLWANSAGGSADDESKGIAVDDSGNSYVTGMFKSSSISFGSVTLTNNGGYELFITKYNSSGSVVWAKSAGGSDDDFGIGLATDSSGNCYLTGYFASSSITFGSTSLINHSSDTTDFFIVKYDPSGNPVWANSAGGTDYDYGIRVATDGSSNSYVVGKFSSSSITFGSTTLINNGSSDIFIVKYDVSGNIVWAKSSGGNLADNGESIVIKANGNIYVTGYFLSSSITFGSNTLINNGLEDIFIVQYDSSGNPVWARSIGGGDSDLAYGITSDAGSNIYVTGYFWSSSINFGPYNLTNNGVSDIFVAKYDDSGNVVWAKSVGGTNLDIVINIGVDGGNNSYLTGAFYSSSITFGSVTLTNNGVCDFYIAKLSGTVGIEEMQQNTDNIQIFPSPFSYETVLQSAKPLNNASLIIENIFGQKVFHLNNLSGNKFTLDRESLPDGIYFINLSENNKIIAAKKIVIASLKK
jgi:hypothetical protein